MKGNKGSEPAHCLTPPDLIGAQYKAIWQTARHDGSHGLHLLVCIPLTPYIVTESLPNVGEGNRKGEFVSCLFFLEGGGEVVDCVR